MENKNKQLQVVDTEFRLIQELLQPVQPSDILISICIQKLKSELVNAKIFNISEISNTVVRLNSIVDIDTPFGELKMQLVLPNNSNSIQKRISILTPMGSALYGYSIGDKVTWNFPNGEKQIEIINVKQSEFA
jgi:regulator of nucleoside diphosphate kinase